MSKQESYTPSSPEVEVLINKTFYAIKNCNDRNQDAAHLACNLHKNNMQLLSLAMQKMKDPADVWRAQQSIDHLQHLINQCQAQEAA